MHIEIQNRVQMLVSHEKVKNTRICPGAEVITTDDAIQKLKEEESYKEKTKRITKKKKVKKIPEEKECVITKGKQITTKKRPRMRDLR